MIAQTYHKLQKVISHLLYSNNTYQKLVSDQFLRIFYGFPGTYQAWRNVSWLGIPTLKCPMDLWIMG